MSIWGPVARIESEKRRLETLRYLARSGGYEAAASLLRVHLCRIGVPTLADQMAACLAWLEEQELVTRRAEGPEAIARITARGRDVAEGAAEHPGVLRPDP